MASPRAVASSSSSSAGHRFASLLKPLRELAANWEVDIAMQLEEYLDELKDVVIQLDGGTRSVNFAEAALLIQGSTWVYSKKVESLYQLVQKTLEFLAQRRTAKENRLPGAEAGGEDESDLLLHVGQEDNFLPLDDIPISHESGITLAIRTPSKSAQKPPTAAGLSIGGTPLNLLRGSEHHGDHASDSPSVLRMRTGRIHSSGAVLMDWSDANLLNGPIGSGMTLSSPPPSSVAGPSGEQGMAEGAQDSEDEDAGDFLGGDMDFDGEDDFGGGMEDYVVEGEQEERQMEEQRRQMLMMGAGMMEEEARLEEDEVDVWEPLDPHCNERSAGGIPPKPFQKKRTFRTQPPVHRELEKWLGSNFTSKVPLKTALGAYDCCVKLFEVAGADEEGVPHAQQLKLIPKLYTNVLNLPEGFWKAETRRRRTYWQQRRNLLRQGKAVAGGVRNPNLAAAPGFDFGDADDGAFDYDDDFGGGEDMGMDMGDCDVENGGVRLEDWEEEPGQEGDFLEESAPQQILHNEASSSTARAHLQMLSSALNPSGEDTYAQLCRQHVAAILSDCEKYAVETDLSRRVNTWQSHVEPILEEQEQHPVFDIDEYGSSILKDMERSGGVGTMCHFGDLVKTSAPSSTSSFEVSRMFLALLQLANAGNVDLQHSSGAVQNDLQMRVLDTSFKKAEGVQGVHL